MFFAETAQQIPIDFATKAFFISVIATLLILFGIGRILKGRPDHFIDSAVVRNFNKRITSWLAMTTILSAALLFNETTTVVIFFLLSFWALREYVTMTPTRRADHRTLFWAFFLFTPAQYFLVGLGREVEVFNSKFDAYHLYSIMIPVYASLFIPFRTALSGDDKRFLERIAKIQFGLLVCVYALSYAPALLYMKLNHWNPSTNSLEPWQDRNVGLLFYFIVLVQVNDVMQFIWDKMVGRKVIAPTINSTRTWEGFFGAAVCTSLIGMLIPIVFAGRVTPFQWFGSGCMALVISVMGFAGSITMSAIKRDRGVKDYGTLVTGHAGVLDRIDSICFAAPVFYHVTRVFLERRPAATIETIETAGIWNLLS
ncbi:MAG: phosphatidate cytidylyltransferase [Pirellulaceae bacterium]|nr:phosphatidate cytidylyltransferase [Pirellulaceae bacterium]MDG2470042.1 phosphatidate cytidylyltransferase [Pirellulaceae bacterium]